MKTADFSMVLLTSLILGSCVSASAAETVIMYEMTNKAPEKVIQEYKFPAPVHSVTLVFERKDGRKPDGSWDRSLAHGEIRIGSLGTVLLPQALFHCLPDPLIEGAVFEFGGYDPKSSKWNSTWWKDNILVRFRYGRAPTYPSDYGTDAAIQTSFYPYIEFIIKDLKLSNIVLTRGEGDVRYIDTALTGCPVEDIDWSLRK